MVNHFLNFFYIHLYNFFEEFLNEIPPRLVQGKTSVLGFSQEAKKQTQLFKNNGIRRHRYRLATLPAADRRISADYCAG